MIVRESYKQWKTLNKDRNHLRLIIITIILCILILLFKYYLLPSIVLFYGSHPIFTYIIGIAIIWFILGILNILYEIFN